MVKFNYSKFYASNQNQPVPMRQTLAQFNI